MTIFIPAGITEVVVGFAWSYTVAAEALGAFEVVDQR
jgi:hypothetical protein